MIFKPYHTRCDNLTSLTLTKCYFKPYHMRCDNLALVKFFQKLFLNVIKKVFYTPPIRKTNMKRNYSTLASVVCGVIFIGANGKALEINEEVENARRDFIENTERCKSKSNRLQIYRAEFDESYAETMKRIQGGYIGLGTLSGVFGGLLIGRQSRRNYQEK